MTRAVIFVPPHRADLLTGLSRLAIEVMVDRRVGERRAGRDRRQRKTVGMREYDARRESLAGRTPYGVVLYRDRRQQERRGTSPWTFAGAMVDWAPPGP